MYVCVFDAYVREGIEGGGESKWSVEHGTRAG